MFKLIERFKKWRDRRRLYKDLVQDTRRALQLMGEATEDLTDQQVALSALYMGSVHLMGQAVVMGARASMPNAVMGRVVEIPLGKMSLN